jgi:Chromo (CHRromatin Organisation MOdifier) domain
MVNASTGFSGFQLHLGHSPCVIPPMIPEMLPEELQDAGVTAMSLIEQLQDNVTQARDNLLLAKITQSHHASANRAPDPAYKVNNLIMLSTANRRHKYKKKGEKCTANFFPRWDSPYRVTASHPEASTYTLDIPTNQFPTYHASELKPHHTNNVLLFPSHEFEQPGPILTADGLEEYLVDKIINSRRCSRRWQYLVRWLSYSPQHDLWIAASELSHCEALDRWYEFGGDGPDSR